MGWGRQLLDDQRSVSSHLALYSNGKDSAGTEPRYMLYDKEMADVLLSSRVFSVGYHADISPGQLGLNSVQRRVRAQS